MLPHGTVRVRISPDGEPAEVRFPERFDPHRSAPGRIRGVLRDGLDVASVAWLNAPNGERGLM